MDIKVEPLRPDLPFGARVRGVDRATVADPAVRAQLQAIFEDKGMILFEEVEQTAEMQVLISNVFGPLKDHPIKLVEQADNNRMPGVIVIRTDPERTVVEIEGKPLMTWQPWHFDHSYNDELNRAGVLRAEAIAPEDGLTAFADGIQIYEALDPDVRARIDGKELLYTLDMRFSEQRFGLPESFRIVRDKSQDQTDLAKTLPRSIHPAVWQRDSGEKVLHMSPYGWRGVVGMDQDDADTLVRETWVEVERVMKTYHHQWRPTDMLIWDNWRMLHMACGCSPEHERIMHRTTIKGDYGFGRWETEPAAEMAHAAAM